MGLDDSYDFALAAASLRANSTDTPALLKALCAQLSDTLGERLHVDRAGGRFRKSEAIAAVRIAMGSETFDATVDGPNLRCAVGHSSGGIRIRSETVDTDEWIVRLLGALRAEATHSDSARRALEHIIIGGFQ